MIQNEDKHWSAVYFLPDGDKLMTKEQKEAMYKEVYGPIEEENAWRKRKNDRILKVLQNAKGKTYVKNLKQLLNDCEVGSGMMEAEFQIVKNRYGQYQHEKYGREIKGYWVEQWSVGMEGDSWEGYIYVELKPGKYLKVDYSI